MISLSLYVEVKFSFLSSNWPVSIEKFLYFFSDVSYFFIVEDDLPVTAFGSSSGAIVIIFDWKLEFLDDGKPFVLASLSAYIKDL